MRAGRGRERAAGGSGQRGGRAGVRDQGAKDPAGNEEAAWSVWNPAPLWPCCGAACWPRPPRRRARKVSVRAGPPRPAAARAARPRHPEPLGARRGDARNFGNRSGAASPGVLGSGGRARAAFATNLGPPAPGLGGLRGPRGGGRARGARRPSGTGGGAGHAVAVPLSASGTRPDGGAGVPWRTGCLRRFPRTQPLGDLSSLTRLPRFCGEASLWGPLVFGEGYLRPAGSPQRKPLLPEIFSTPPFASSRAGEYGGSFGPTCPRRASLSSQPAFPGWGVRFGAASADRKSQSQAF